jgi:Zn-dependent protease with chaperone function
MVGASIALAALAVLLAWPVPILLSGATWTRRAPAVALALWQSIALAGGLSMIGALLTFGLAPFGNDLVDSAIGFSRLDGVAQPWHVLALCAALLLALHLLFNLVATIVRSERQRRRHGQLVTLLSSPLESGARLIDSPTPVAYCLPGPFSSVMVYSAGLVELLDPAELEAVIAHERAHVSQRHDVVLIAFRAWYASLHWFPIAYRAQRDVGLLIEMLADDRARQSIDSAVLARAIAAVGAGAAPRGDVPSAAELSVRIERLDLPALPLTAEALVIGAALALVGVPTALLLAPALVFVVP